jgi:hypothetical protein
VTIELVGVDWHGGDGVDGNHAGAAGRVRCPQRSARTRQLYGVVLAQAFISVASIPAREGTGNRPAHRSGPPQMRGPALQGGPQQWLSQGGGDPTDYADCQTGSATVFEETK